MLQPIGTSAVCKIITLNQAFKIKIDTGAAGSSMHAEDIVSYMDELDNLRVKFVTRTNILGVYPLTSHHDSPVVGFVPVKSSNGESKSRFVVVLDLHINNKYITARVSLTDRSKMTYPMLLGNRDIKGVFIVDPSLTV